jgi:hypothetical protein
MMRATDGALELKDTVQRCGNGDLAAKMGAGEVRRGVGRFL